MAQQYVGYIQYGSCNATNSYVRISFNWENNSFRNYGANIVRNTTCVEATYLKHFEEADELSPKTL